MNFEGLPLIHSPTGFWIAFAIMLALGVGMSVFFWRKRYLGRATERLVAPSTSPSAAGSPGCWSS